MPILFILRILHPSVTIHRKLLAFGLILLLQGPAMLVQEVAWVNMLVTYTQERGLKRGVIETFDGEHPCEMCKAAQKLRQQGDAPEEPTAPQQVRPSLVWGTMMIPAGVIQAPFPASSDFPPTLCAWRVVGQGRGADGPESPPPEWG